MYLISTDVAAARTRDFCAPSGVGAPITEVNAWLRVPADFAAMPDRRHVPALDTVYINDNSIGATAVVLTQSGDVAHATKQAAPPRGVPC